MARENGDDATLAETFLSVLQELARTMEVLLVPQPALTLAEPLCTDFRFSRAATKLTTGRDDSDFGHMNGLYGAIVIRKFIAAAKLAERPEPKRIGYRKAPSTFSGLARNVAARLAIHAARR
jgi:hypothetical protein